MTGGQGGARPLWSPPSEATGTPAAFDKADGPEKRWLEAFLGSGTRIAAKLQAEIARARALQFDVFSAAGVTAPPKGTLFHIPDAGFGYRTSKVLGQVLGEDRGARLTALENRASDQLPDDQRRRAFEMGHNGKYSNPLLSGVPLPAARHPTQEFQIAVWSMLGMESTCPIPFTDHTAISLQQCIAPTQPGFMSWFVIYTVHPPAVA